MNELFQELPNDPTEVPNAYEALVGEGKKFADNESLAKGKLESDRFIGHLQTELAELRAKQTQQLTLEEIMTKIKEASVTPAQQPPATPPAKTEDSPKDIESIVNTMLAKKSTEERLAKNAELVRKTLTEKFGADAQLHLNKKANELGVSLKDLATIASESPNVFFATIGVTPGQTQASPAFPAPRTHASTPPNSGSVKNNAYYQKMKDTDWANYSSQATQMEMYREAMKQGNSFFE